MRQVSQAALAKEVGQAQTTISSWERGRTEPSRDDVARVAKALGITAADLEFGANEMTVPVVGYVGAGDAAHFYDSSQGPFDRVSAPEDATDRTRAAVVRGTSIGRFFDGWLVFWEDRHEGVTTDMYGQLCIVGLPDGRILVKWLQPARTTGLFHLLSETEGPIHDQEVAWAAIVTSMRPR